MLVTLIFCSIFINFVRSDLTRIELQLEVLLANNSQHFRGPLRFGNGRRSGALANAVRNLDEYGCWCYFYENVGRGKGAAVDEIDEFCKTLHEGYECAIRDSEEVGETCVPWEVTRFRKNFVMQLYYSNLFNSF